MGALKWFGYLVVAILALTLVIGVILTVVALATFGGAVVCVVGLIWLVAASIKGLVEAPRG